jgi:hypothetical protein
VGDNGRAGGGIKEFYAEHVLILSESAS